MTQADRDRLVTLKKAKKKLITRGEAAEELGVSTRQVKRLLKALKKRGDKARDPRVAWQAVEPAGGRGYREGSREDPIGGGLRRVWADIGGGVSEQTPRDRGEQRDAATVDDSRQTVAREASEGKEGARLATAAQPFWGVGAVGHQ